MLNYKIPPLSVFLCQFDTTCHTQQKKNAAPLPTKAKTQHTPYYIYTYFTNLIKSALIRQWSLNKALLITFTLLMAKPLVIILSRQLRGLLPDG